jgi:hypothetical protein
MRHSGRRRALALAVVALSLLPLTLSAQKANAALEPPLIEFHYLIDSSTTVKKLNQTIEVPTGEFIGAISLQDGSLEGALTLPPAEFTFEVAGVGLATGTAKIKPVGNVTGSVDFFHFPLVMTATTSFHLRIVSVYASPAGIPVGPNMVGDLCRTVTPMSITMQGPIDISNPSTVSGTFTIPNFQYCGLAVGQALNLLISGPDNTFSATATPAGGPLG